MALLAVHNLHKTYRLGRVDVPVLRGVSLSVEPGEWVAVLGASGSGKSTLLHLLGGLDRPDSPADGKPASKCPRCGYTITGLKAATCPECGNAFSRGGDIHYDGASLAEYSARRLDAFRATEVGFVFQFYHLLPELNVQENVAVGAMVKHGRFGYRRRAKEVSTRAAELLDAFGLGHRLKHRPAELSGGERQRVAIARALINKPRVLLADEPTGNLDRATGEKIMDQVTRLRDDTLTIVMVTHDPAIAARASRVVTLEDGRVVETKPAGASTRR
ncbi:MAG: ATP-binding cassette domain-containing protein [Phycisphaerales bacterium]